MSQDNKLSTSALARRLEVPVQQLFAVLKDHNWIKKLDEGWALTAKGEFEGGSYVNSARYGRYIVWPSTLIDHALLKDLDGDKLLSVAGLAKQLSLSPRQINRLFVELGWLKPSCRGWILTPQSKHLGAQAVENQHSGLSYAMWPEDTIHHAAFDRLLRRCLPPIETGDLLQQSEPPLTLDGCRCHSWPHWQLAQWLYLAGLRYAYQRDLPLNAALRADFYLPDHGIYLEYWGGEDSAEQLSARMQRVEFYKSATVSVIDVHPEDLSDLDEYLSRRMTDLQVDFY